MTSPYDFATSSLTTALRGLSGITAQPAALRPQHLLQLYDIETCPYCRIVREALTELDLDAEIYPCPKRGKRFRPEARARGGKTQFPLLIDPNNDVAMYESLDIIAYLYATYGQRELPLKWRAGRWQQLNSMLASAPRLDHGLVATDPDRPPADADATELLELYSFEASPFARPVRETLCELELPYRLRSCGRNRLSEWLPPALREQLQLEPNSDLPNRVQLQRREGRVQIPYLHDPNTDTSLFESSDIVAYLRQTYGKS